MKEQRSTGLVADWQSKLLLQDQLHELNVALKRHKTRPGYTQHFIDVARELLPKPLYRAISDQALKRDDAANAEPADASR